MVPGHESLEIPDPSKVFLCLDIPSWIQGVMGGEVSEARSWGRFDSDKAVTRRQREMRHGKGTAKFGLPEKRLPAVGAKRRSR